MGHVLGVKLEHCLLKEVKSIIANWSRDLQVIPLVIKEEDITLFPKELLSMYGDIFVVVTREKEVLLMSI